MQVGVDLRHRANNEHCRKNQDYRRRNRSDHRTSELGHSLHGMVKAATVTSRPRFVGLTTSIVTDMREMLSAEIQKWYRKSY